MRRLALSSTAGPNQASLAGIALALRALAPLLGRRVEPGEILFEHGEKPRLAPSAADFSAADFSIAHAGPWAACAALLQGRVGLDLEVGADARIADFVVREALLKGSGEGLRAFGEIRDLNVDQARLGWRGTQWHLRRLQSFEGACACVVTSREVRALETHTMALEELFDS